MFRPLFSRFLPVLLLSASPAAADLITVQFTGSVTEIDAGGGVDLSSEFALAEAVSGYIVFEDSVSHSGGSSNQGNFADAIQIMEVDIGDYHLSLDQRVGGHILETNNSNLNGPFRGDHIRTIGLRGQGEPVALATPEGVVFGMSDAEDGVFPDNASTKTLTPNPDFSQFDVGRLWLDFALLGEGFGGSRQGTVRVTLDSFTAVPTAPTTRNLLAVVDLETEFWDTGGADHSSFAGVIGSFQKSVFANFSSVGDDGAEVTWKAPAGKAIEITVPSGFTLDGIEFLLKSFAPIGTPDDLTVPLSVEVETAGGAILPAPATATLRLSGPSNTGMEARVTFTGLTPGVSYRFKSLTATGVVPAAYNGSIDAQMDAIYILGQAGIPAAAAAPDPGQWVRLVDETELTPELEIVAPAYRAAVAGSTIHLPMEVRLNSTQAVSGWSFGIEPGPGLTISSPTVLGTAAAATTDLPPGERLPSGMETTEFSLTPTGGIVSTVSLSSAGTATLAPGGAPHTLLRFILSGPAPPNGFTEPWSVGFVEGLQGTGPVVTTSINTSAGIRTPYIRTAGFNVIGTLPATLTREGANLKLEWFGNDPFFDVYSFTDISHDSVTLWQKSVPGAGGGEGEGSSTVRNEFVFPLPNEPRRFFTVIPAPRVGGGGPGGPD